MIFYCSEPLQAGGSPGMELYDGDPVNFRRTKFKRVMFLRWGICASLKGSIAIFPGPPIPCPWKYISWRGFLGEESRSN